MAISLKLNAVSVLLLYKKLNLNYNVFKLYIGREMKVPTYFDVNDFS